MEINFKYTDNIFKVRSWIEELATKKVIACDFEVASLYDDEEKARCAKKLEDSVSDEDKLYFRQIINSNGLSYPALTKLTHLSVAWSANDAYVFILAKDNVRNALLEFLTDTEVLELWHNACYDLKHVYYYTHKFPKHFIDTQLLAKCYLNNASNALCDTSLKYLMKDEYGDWAIAKDNFNQNNQYDEKMLEYSATDACATYALFRQMCKKHRQILDYLENIF